MEEFWRLERNDGSKPSSGVPSTGPGSVTPQGGMDMGESPSEESPSSPAGPGPQVKFNGMPAPKPAPPMQTPMPQTATPLGVSQMQVELSETEISTVVTDIGMDPGWSISDVLCILYDCASQCQRTLACIANSPEAPMRTRQMSMLRDTAEICHLAWCYLQRNSRFSLKALKLCANICEVCADTCSAHLDLDSQRCAATCMRCAAACRAFIAANS